MLTAAPAGSGQRFEESQIHMGVEFKIVLYASDENVAHAAFRSAFQRIAQLDGIMSDYNPDSELSRLTGRAPTTEPVQVSDDLWHVLAASQKFSELSEGAFDVTVGPLSRLWRRARRQKELPPSDMLAAAREAVGYRHIQLSEATQSVTLDKADMRLDLGGIAKGYAADEALEALRKAGITQALVDASGDLVLGDAPPDSTGWKIGVAPLDRDAPPSRFLLLANGAVATSGDAWQFVEIDGRRYSHIIDPRTGTGLTDHSSVTVIAKTGMQADALASTVSVLGPCAGLRLIDGIEDAAALVVRAPAGKLEIRESKRFKSLPEP